MSKLGRFLVCLRNSTEVSMAGAEWTGEAQAEVREQTVGSISSRRALLCKNFGFDSEGCGRSGHSIGTIWLTFWLGLFLLLFQEWPEVHWQKQRACQETEFHNSDAQSHIHTSGRVSSQTWWCLCLVMPLLGAGGLTKSSLSLDVADFPSACGQVRKLLWGLCYFGLSAYITKRKFFKKY